MADRMGFDGFLYYNTSGSGGGGTWVELKGVEDVSLGMENAEADITTRDMRGYEAVRHGLRRWTVEVEIVWDPSIASFQAIRDAYLNKTVLGLRVLDGPTTTTGSQGPMADFVVLQFNRNEGQQNVMTVSVVMKLTRSTTAPSWFTA